MKRRQPSASRMRTMFGTHLRSKALMVVVAFLIWLFVRTDQENTVVVTMPVKVRMEHLPDYVLLKPPIEELSITIRGRGRRLLYFALFQSGEYVLRPDDAEERTHTVSTQNVMLRGVPGITVLNVSPALLHLTMDKRISREVPVALRAKIRPAEGYVRTSDLTWEPRTVIVSGASTLLDTLQAVYTDAVTMNKVKHDLKRKLDLNLPFRGAKLAGATVELSATIEKVVSKRIENIPLTVLNLPDSLEVVPMELSLILKAGENQLATIGAHNIQATLDYLKWQTDSSEVACELLIPYGLPHEKSFPEHFLIRHRLMEPDSSSLDSLGFQSLLPLPGF